ncbi:MAG: HAMP domain-containing histidine kinase [Chloroflexi bacterium]|nr:MAG: HAMP domain-containing histidine kinase [Chloroflexota bacterium]
MNLRAKLILAYTGLIIIGFGGLALVAGRQISQGAIEDFERGFITQAELVARGLKDAVEHFKEGETSQAEVETAVQEYATQLNIEITLIDTTGRPWLSSSPHLPTPNFKEYPEVKNALDRQKTYDVRTTNNTTTLYAAAPIIEDGQVISVVQIATPFTQAQATVWQRWAAMTLGITILTIVAIIASLWLSTSLTKPLTQLRESVLKLASGDFSQHLPEDRTDEIGELARAFNHMANQVQAMLEEQRSFASNASHELRTPLTTIRLRSEALREGNLDEETAQQYIAEIDDEITRLSALVNDLMLLSRFDSGRAERGREAVQFHRLVQSLIREATPKIQSRQLTISLEIPDTLPAVQANINHLQVVFRNLLDNAIKYTPPNGKIRWRIWQEDGFVVSELTDTGTGIAPEDLPHLFKRFYRADKAHTRDAPGTGLGLPLAKSIVEFYQGRIVVHSHGIGTGTSVTVWWPINEDKDESDIT